MSFYACREIVESEAWRDLRRKACKRYMHRQGRPDTRSYAQLQRQGA
jgi:hypothetical protein